ncbi:E3 ubiquitin ligase PARAQUAT TOLERANCE 3 [Scaptodrosophila lebanonensis]|uniref:E3 ubiquitin ligase PARAQUAT TOLERANCE 3 n=1 Tax=Drosophila lebanonensis TaxID=7225 RepID=A0A6J2U9I0_DROLE|nr:E3 ubiquitin ligase PARAQUAT TOLERANCE 3 [Scaptodrosophila lebanonensis]
MSVHYKFKSTLNYDTITFDGLHISVGDLKREIVQQKRLGKVIDFDLQITNAQTKEEYKEDGFLIPKNTTLIISRIPITHQPKKGWDPPTDPSFASTAPPKQDNFSMDLSKMQGSEEDKIQAMMMQSTADYDPKTYHRIKGQSQVGEVPPSYRCNKCKKGGHWIKNCPFVSGKDQFETKRNTGIPRSFRDKPDMSMNQATQFLPAEEKQEIPEDLVCGICRDLFVDAVMIPCCGSSFCDDCVRTALLDSEDNECPDCKEKNCSPGSLIPNRFLRNSVNVFKNETGYKIGTYKTADQQVATPPQEEQEGEEEEVPSSQTSETGNKTEEQEQPEEKENIKTKEAEDSDSQPTTNSETVVKDTDKDKDKSDSEYEDNITIKMPTKKMVENTFGIPGSDNVEVPKSPPKKESVNPIVQRKQKDYQYDSEPDNRQRMSAKTDNYKPQNERSLLPTPISVHHNYQSQNLNDQMEKPLLTTEMANNAHRMNVYKPPYIQMPRGPPLHMMGHHIPQYSNGYNTVAHRPPIGYGPYQNQPVHQIRPPYIAPPNVNMNSSQAFQSKNLASIYQGVAAKVGTGLIDDPLEAFNRIMKEKEKKKIERRRSPDRHRSRSPDRQRHRFKSPLYERESSKDTHLKDKLDRSRDRKREPSYERRIHRSTRPWTKAPDSPNEKRKRSHHRSPSPKSAYKPSKEKQSSTKTYRPKVDSHEPPPPGFESLQIGGSTDSDSQKRTSSCLEPVSESKMENHENFDDEFLPRKRQRSSSKSEFNQPDENFYRGHTPPTKGSSAKVPKGDHIPYQSPPRTPKKEIDPNLIDNSKHRKELISRTLSPDNFEPNTHIGKENDVQLDSQLKERKKKKKVKSEKKKSKKDKKEKRDKSKKSISPENKSKQRRSPNPESGPTPVIDNSNITDMFSESNSKVKSIIGNDSCGDVSDPEPKKELNTPARKTREKSPIERLRRVDSVLDIEGYDSDFGEGNNVSKSNKKIDVDTIHVSKWETEDNNTNTVDPSKKVVCNTEQEHDVITSDVIRKAENAIFAKAINAIRPVEFKVILDSRSNSKDRAISIRNDPKDRSISPKHSMYKSVKDRLGSKVVRDKMQSPNHSKERRGESPRRNTRDGKYRSTPEDYRSRKRSRSSKERFVNTDKKNDNKERRRSRSSDRNKRDVKPKRERNREPSLVEKPKYKSRDREQSESRHNRNNDKKKFDDHGEQNISKNTKTVESRVIVATRPCRPDNPFRKFDDGNVSNNIISKLEKGIRHEDDQSNSEDELEKVKRKNKKLKKHSKCSSTESSRSERRLDLKSKRKSKLLKKKKKSKK